MSPAAEEGEEQLGEEAAAVRGLQEGGQGGVNRGGDSTETCAGGQKGRRTGTKRGGDTYPAGAAALTFGKEQRRTLQNRPGGAPALPGDRKKG